MELSPDELLEFDSRYALSPDVVAQLRESAEDGVDDGGGHAMAPAEVYEEAAELLKDYSPEMK